MLSATVLTGLRLENIALIERLQLDFLGGFTVLTGETGAGKSILLDALDALLGGNGPRLLRQGRERGLIEASFSLTPPLARWLEQQQLDPDEAEILLSREWRLSEGRLSSRHRLNGVAVNRGQIQELRPLLLDLTVQGQTQQLGRPGQQRRWLDRFAGEPIQGQLPGVARAYRRWKQAAADLAAARASWQQLQQERERQARLQQEKAAAEKAAREKAAAEKATQAKAAQAKAAQDKAAREKAAQADAARRQAQLEADRQKNLERMLGQAGATGGPSATGTADRAAGPSASYAGKLVARIRPNIVFTEVVSGNPKATVEVRTLPDGTVLGSKLLQASGVPAWDQAVLRAIERTGKLPRDDDGRVPSTLILDFRPRD